MIGEIEEFTNEFSSLPQGMVPEPKSPGRKYKPKNHGKKWPQKSKKLPTDESKDGKD